MSKETKGCYLVYLVAAIVLAVGCSSIRHTMGKVPGIGMGKSIARNVSILEHLGTIEGSECENSNGHVAECDRFTGRDDTNEQVYTIDCPADEGVRQYPVGRMVKVTAALAESETPLHLIAEYVEGKGKD